jgi:hypothetical protein
MLYHGLQMAMQVACQVGCRVVAVESDRGLHNMAVALKQAFDARVRAALYTITITITQFHR